MTAIPSNPLWFKDAVIYEVHVKTFYDANGDGIGDFRGLIEKIDYFVELGITAVWLLPFYPSPLRDDGYDIADYQSVNPNYGTLADFQEFLEAAHQRGLRVITELVLNHTSDQNAWFQAARRAPAGSPEREFYVWSDTPNRYTEARIIFKDFEASNWTWDPVAKAYFWHRFYNHQPDLNFDNPAVHKALFDVIDYWLAMGVDGLRLDAVPYLYEREQTNCENLPETHVFLKKLRAHIDSKFQDRMLLAEANQWPEDAAAYFGDGDECQMNFHFPLMPRLFMSLQMEDRFPIIDILDQTPEIPANCQWATFLRNHDELTLEMVTDEERDYMYRVYAEDTRARINLGIRRRLAPLLGNNRRRIELINALLFSLPGTPIIYYGDEIGMGDNFYLGDRNGVRTPMQWAPDRNGGFSKANPQQLYLPAIIDPEYHFEAVNVENQQRSLSSLFWWMRRLIAERKRWHAFGHGTIEFLHPENSKVLAFLRRDGDQAILVLANLSRFVQMAELDLSEWAGVRPLEVFSRNRFPEIKQTSAFSLGPHDFYWLALRRDAASTAGVERVAAPVYDQLFTWRGALASRERELLERELLPAYLQGCRWFPAGTRTLRELKIVDDFSLKGDAAGVRVLLVHAAFTEGLPETYVLPVGLAPGEAGARVAAEHPATVIARFVADGSEAVLHEGLHDTAFQTALLEEVAQVVPSHASMVSRRSPSWTGDDMPRLITHASLVEGEGSNISFSYGGTYHLKMYRRLDWGKQPEEELTRYLSDLKGYEGIAGYAGALEYGNSRGQRGVLALVTHFVQNQGDGWAYALDAVGRYFERILATRPEPSDPNALLETVGAVFPPRARQLGKLIGGLHKALAEDADHPAFAPEPFGTLYQRSLYQAMRGSLRRTVALLKHARSKFEDHAREAAEAFIHREADLLERFAGLNRARLAASKTAVHGSFHLGQVLNTGNDFVIIDLEGDPARPLSERALKRSPLVDVASMMRSFDYAAHAGLRRQAPADVELLEPWAHAWTAQVSKEFVSAYVEEVKGSVFLPPGKEDFDMLLDVFLLDRAVAEITHEMTHRPGMVGIPLHAVERMLR